MDTHNAFRDVDAYKMADVMKVCSFVLLLLFLSSYFAAKGKKDTKKKTGKEKTKIGKDILDYNEVDMERLLDQWDENDGDIDEEDKFDDNDPRKPRPKVAFDPSMAKDDPMALLKMAKKGKTIMMFVSIAGNPTRQQAEQITGRWQGSLFNAQFQVDRYLVADDRALFLLKDGGTAWEIKDFLVQQPECKEVTFENQNFPGAAAGKSDMEQKGAARKEQQTETEQNGKSGNRKKTEL